VVSAVSADQIARSPDGDAGQAVQRVSGVTVQDGKYVFVRGLGERYTTTSLNGARVPSPEPERKVVPLDIFPSSLLETITTSKTFTPDQGGDFSGAAVNIKTKEFPAQRQVRMSVSAGLNTEGARGSAPAAPTAGGEWAALTGVARDLPAAVAAEGNFQQRPISQGEHNQMVSSFRRAWTPAARDVLPNSSFGFSVGGSDPVFGRTIGYVLSGTYSYAQETQADLVRGQARAGSVTGTAEASDRFEGTLGRTSVLWGGILNLSTTLGAHSRLSLNNTYNRSADNEARTESGFSENLGGDFRIDRLRYVERRMQSHQLAGEHDAGRLGRLDWSATVSAVNRSEPDRSEFVYALEENGAGAVTPRWFGGGNEGAVRTFAELDERSFEGALNHTFALGAGPTSPAVKIGGLVRATSRESDNRAYGISARGLTNEQRTLAPEEIFDGRFAGAGASHFMIAPLAQGGSYEAEDRLYAGYAMTEIAFSDRVRLITGARLEHSRVRVDAQSTLGRPATAEPRFTDVLPSATLNIGLGDRQNIRLAVSQTLSRPEYRELADIQYRDVLGGDNVSGNPELVRTLIQNADLRWELYPTGAEVVSVGVFAKRFDNPIERVYLATSGTRTVKYVNAEEGRNYGVELELRKHLGFLGEPLRDLTLFTNATVMRSDVTIGTSEASKTNDERAMVGQAPYVVNAGLTWATLGGVSATALYNRVGRRIVSAAESPLPDVYEEPRDVIDLSLRFPIAGTLSGRVDAKNLLDEAHVVTQGDVLRESYRTGRSFTMGFSWGL
jgi:hypothetical protein